MDRIKAMCELDVVIAREMSPPSDISDEAILAGLHKARCELFGAFNEITQAMVDESTKWLTERGMAPRIRFEDIYAETVLADRSLH